MPGWAWIAAGLVLVGIELMVPLDFWLVFIGLSALALGALDALGLQLGLGTQLLSWAGLSAAAALTYQLAVKPRLAGGPSRDLDALEGNAVVASTAMAPGGPGEVELRGARWSARNLGDAAVEVGDRCVVAEVDGLTLHIHKEG